ncbi:zinc-ribbon and DUF3426 domain-containing protein [Sulfuriferula nivalis]|uniref:Zinc finger/thioredoxin putative domain-containing protein n=1 Tax=Sulfuriferula nivalis TaxID=2675298 RepID=A0A809SBQ6_9PROT|nr:zinc-ribbon and DUF3426 domain-containing protein [Sulfuriferula nivalis]BBP02482.1 hypothetical protein SFSGTM_31900 [Sulfuriferula nivalis]
MILHTACPICHTVFKVDEQHLSSAQGMVQCGVCGMVFNAAQHIQPSVHTQSPVVSSVHIDEVETQTLITNSDSIESDIIIEEELPAVHETTVTDDITTNTDHSLISSDIIDSAYATDVPIQFKKQISRSRKISYAMGTMLLTSLLLLQISIPYRYQLSSSLPVLKPLFNTLCEGHLCTMEPPYDVSQIELTNSNFEIEQKNKKFIKVTLALQNNANYKLQFPRFLLTLLDSDDTVVSIRKISPDDYISFNRDFLQPHDERIIKLDLSVNESAVSNYKIRFF